MRLKPIKILVIQRKIQTNLTRLKNPKLNPDPINTKEKQNKSDKVKDSELNKNTTKTKENQNKSQKIKKLKIKPKYY
jgi:hypothetical protein